MGKRVKSSYFSGNLYFEILGVEYDMTPSTTQAGRSFIPNEEGSETIQTNYSFEEEMKVLHRINIRDKHQPMLRVRVLERGFKSGEEDNT